MDPAYSAGDGSAFFCFSLASLNAGRRREKQALPENLTTVYRIFTFIHQNLHLSADERKQRFEAFFIEKINDLDGQIGLTLLHAALKNNDSKKIINIIRQNGSRLAEENTVTGQSHMARAMIPFSKAIVMSQPFDVVVKLIAPEMLTMHFSNHARTPFMQKMAALEKAGKIEPTAIRMVAFDVGAGRVLKKENPLSELRTKFERIENTSKFKPG